MSDDKKKTDSELLEIASQNVTFKPPKKVNNKLRRSEQHRIDFDAFIKDMRLKPGIKPILRQKLYLAYTRWSDNPMPAKSFGIMASIMFTSNGFSNAAKVYYINFSNFYLQPKAIRKKRERNEVKEETEEEKDYETVVAEVPGTSERTEPESSSGDN